MDMSIAFPHLHIYLEHVGKNFQIFGVTIAYYGVVIAVGMLLGVWLALREAKRIGLDEDRMFNLIMIAIIAGIIGARVYYVAFRWEDYRGNWLDILNYRNGGIAIYGGIIGALLAMVIYTRVKKMSLRKVVDASCLGLLVGQICGRWGNFFNREAFGGYTDSLFAMRLPESAVRKSDITAEIAAHAADGYIQVHPTFLYESVWNLCLLILLLLYRKHKKFDGEVFLLYVLGYGLGRAWIEGLRTDQLLLPIVHLPVSQLLSAVLVIVSLAAIVVGRIRVRKRKSIGK